MSDLDLLIDLHLDGARQGPGGDAETRLAIALSGLAASRGLTIADIGCGTGAASRVLARDLDASVIAVDRSATFLGRLEAEARREGLGARILPLAAAMEALPLAAGTLDAIWSEGAIYCMGFAEGIRAWRRFLKPGGVLAVSELTWLTRSRPAEIEAHWRQEYPEVDTASAKIAVLEANGYAPVGYFVLPRRCWCDGYYRPLQARFAGFLARHGNSPTAQAIVAAEKAEIALYDRHGAYFGYGFYLARRMDD